MATSPYPEPNRPPPRPDASVSSQKARLNPLGRALASALTALAEEDDLTALLSPPPPTDAGIDADASKRKGSDDSSDDSNDAGSNRGRKRPRSALDEGSDAGSRGINMSSLPSSSAKPRVDSKMKEQLLQAFGDAVAETDWYGDTSTKVGTGTVSQRTGRQQRDNTTTSTALPPAALLRGKVKHYNRYGGQWRIVAKDVEIRPRVSLEGKDGKVRNKAWKREDRQSLWDRSIEEEEEAGWKQSSGGEVLVAAEASTDTPASSGGLNLETGGNALTIDGDVVILAYDDV